MPLVLPPLAAAEGPAALAAAAALGALEANQYG